MGMLGDSFQNVMWQKKKIAKLKPGQSCGWISTNDKHSFIQVLRDIIHARERTFFQINAFLTRIILMASQKVNI